MSLGVLEVADAVLWAQAGDGGGGAGGGGWATLTFWMPFILIAVLFYFLLLRPQRQEQARRQAMLGAIKKNDRVLTIGGIYGVVTNVQRESDEVTIKVDESTNTKLRMTLSSIARVLGEQSGEEGTGRLPDVK